MYSMTTTWNMTTSEMTMVKIATLSSVVWNVPGSRSSCSLFGLPDSQTSVSFQHELQSRMKKKTTAGSVGRFDVRVSREEVRRLGKIDLDLVRNTTEEDIARQSLEDNDPRPHERGPARLMYAGPNVRELRTKLGLSQEAFSERFGISLRTLQQWEQERRLPDGQAALLLRIIERAPNIVASVVRSKTS
jgi:putative transcriptional regulator